MKLTFGILATAVAPFLVIPVTAEETKPVAPAPAAAEEAVDDEWLNTIWTQVDDMVKEEEFKLQETVTVAGVRGAEAEDNILDKLYYKGAKRYPSQDMLRKAIGTLKEAIDKDPKGADTPKRKFFIAQCYHKLGQTQDARDFYRLVVKDHTGTAWGTKAQKALMEMAAK